jgi:hypothetical protein
LSQRRFVCQVRLVYEILIQSGYSRDGISLYPEVIYG